MKELRILIFIALVTIANSGVFNCGRNRILCINQCVHLRDICDGSRDCMNHIDEQACPNKALTLWGMLVDNMKIPTTTETISWLMKQRKPLRGWGKDTNRVVVVLFLSNPQPFNMNISTDELTVKDLQLELLERLQRSRNSISTYELALYSHALLSTCQNPMDFFGFNVVKMIENDLNVSGSFNPFLVLALCNSNGSIPQSSTKKLIDILEQSIQPIWIDQQAYALMALNCLHNKNKEKLDLALKCIKRNETHFYNYDYIKKSAQEMFIALQNENGNFGDIYTTALMVQALLSSENFNNLEPSIILNAFNYILTDINENNSLNDITSAYLLLPLLNGKTLLDLGKMNCSSAQQSMEEELESRTEKQIIWYSIWIGDEKKYIYSMSLNIPINATFYDAMLSAADMHKKYRFKYVQFPRGKYITTLSGISNNAEARKYWYLFRLENDHPTVSYIYPDHVTTNYNESFVYWYRSIITDDEDI